MSEYRDHPLAGVKARREMLGIKATDIARELGITLSSYMRHENGSRRIYFDKALTLASILQIDPRLMRNEPTIDERIATLEMQKAKEASQGSPILEPSPMMTREELFAEWSKDLDDEGTLS